MSTPGPIFILAAPFCGASYLAAVLGRHPQLCAVPELNLFMADRVSELLDLFSIGQGTHGQGLLRALAELEFGAQTDDGVERARAWLGERADWSGAELLAALAQRAAPRRLVVPDTETPLRLPDLLRLHAAAPQATLLQLVRHPYSMSAGLASWLSQRLFVPVDLRDNSRHPPIIDPQVAWYRANGNIERHAPAALRLRVEDLDGDTTLHALCAQLGLDADARALAAMREPDAWMFAGYGPRSAPYGLEADVLETIELPRHWDATPALDRALPWRDDGKPFSPDLVALARRYGYA